MNRGAAHVDSRVHWGDRTRGRSDTRLTGRPATVARSVAKHAGAAKAHLNPPIDPRGRRQRQCISKRLKLANHKALSTRCAAGRFTAPSTSGTDPIPLGARALTARVHPGLIRHGAHERSSDLPTPDLRKRVAAQSRLACEWVNLTQPVCGTHLASGTHRFAGAFQRSGVAPHAGIAALALEAFCDPFKIF